MTEKEKSIILEKVNRWKSRIDRIPKGDLIDIRRRLAYESCVYEILRALKEIESLPGR